jgi:hypothetical protein
MDTLSQCPTLKEMSWPSDTLVRLARISRWIMLRSDMLDLHDSAMFLRPSCLGKHLLSLMHRNALLSALVGVVKHQRGAVG